MWGNCSIHSLAPDSIPTQYEEMSSLRLLKLLCELLHLLLGFEKALEGTKFMRGHVCSQNPIHTSVLCAEGSLRSVPMQLQRILATHLVSGGAQQSMA